MSAISYQIGDRGYAAEDIYNDGGMPGVAQEDGLVVPASSRGVVVHYGVAELDESKEIYLVQFESSPNDELGAPVGCLPDELPQSLSERA